MASTSPASSSPPAPCPPSAADAPSPAVGGLSASSPRRQWSSGSSPRCRWAVWFFVPSAVGGVRAAPAGLHTSAPGSRRWPEAPWAIGQPGPRLRPPPPHARPKFCVSRLSGPPSLPLWHPPAPRVRARLHFRFGTRLCRACGPAFVQAHPDRRIDHLTRVVLPTTLAPHPV